MVGQPIRLGPFTGGLNKAAEPTSVNDNELVECLNFELDIDGTLVNRPAIQVIREGASDDRLLIFGSVTFGGTPYLFATRSGSTFVSSTEGASWIELNPDNESRECKTMAVYQNKVWLPATPNSAHGGISWSVEDGAEAVEDMPRGEACVVHKNRLYIVPGETATENSSRLYFSEGGDFTTYVDSNNIPNFIDVSPGDGTSLNNIIIHQDNLLLFKQDSTYLLAYDLNPHDAILRQINAVVGSTGSLGVTQHENNAYCIHRYHVYEIVNYNFELLNLKVPFEYDADLPPNTTARYENHNISTLGDRLVVRYFNRTYVFNLRTRTWSEWRKVDETSPVEWHIFGPLIRVKSVEASDMDEYYTTYSFDMDDGSGYKIIRIIDGKTSGVTEGYGNNEYCCIATTKDYDMADPVRYKKVFWWGADVISGNTIVGDIKPITVIFSPTWEELGDLTWGQLGTWEFPLEEIPTTQTIIPADGVFNTNKLVKFLKSLRARKFNFSVKLHTNGSLTEPAVIFSYIAILKTKQQVSQESS